MRNPTIWNFLKGLSNERLWIGGFCTDKTKCSDMKSWRWADGKSWSYTRWFSYQPDTYLGLQYNLVMNHVVHGYWDDENPDHNLPYMCQAAPIKYSGYTV